MLTLLTLAFASTHQPWAPRTVQVADTLNGFQVTTSERDGWIVRTAGHMAYGADDMAFGDGGVRMRAEPARSGRPGRPMPMAEGAPATGSGGGGIAPVAPMQQGPLKAGTTDDNQAFGEFLEFLETWKGKPGIAGQHVEMEVADRTGVRVRGATGQPVPGARVTVSRHGRHLWTGMTYGDGSAPFYPELLGAEGKDLVVQVDHDGLSRRVKWDGARPLSLSLDDGVDDAMALDVVFVIDTTGSMSDEIERIKATLLAVTAKVHQLDRPVDLRYGAVLYRDIGDEYLTKHTPLTTDLEGFDARIQGIRAGGGGDGPESYNQGLAVAVGEMEWREDAGKLVFLVADAQPHMDYEDDVDYAQVAQAALSQGIRIHTVAASGLQDFGSLVFRQTSQLTQGRFVFIEYGSTAASAADHGVTGPVSSNNLDGILYDQIAREVDGWGRAES